MDIENLIDELEDIIEISWHLPFSGGRAIVDTKKLKKILEDIRLKLPKEMIQAQKIVEDRAKILEDAKSEVNTMMKISEEKIRSMVNKSEIVKNAQTSANDIIAKATIESKEMKSSANKYVEEVMKQLDEVVTSNLSEIRKARQALSSSSFKSE